MALKITTMIIKFKRILVKILLKLKIISLEECNVIDGYVLLIMHGVANIDRVPAKHKQAVLVKLAALGLDGYGDTIPTNTIE